MLIVKKSSVGMASKKMKHETPINFSLAPYIYATTFDDAIIILDGKADKYISLVDDAAKSFHFILSSDFLHTTDGSYRANTDQLEETSYNDWISYFIEKNFIIPSVTKAQLNRPVQQGGLKEYRWDTQKTSWKPFSVASIGDILKAYFLLHRVHRIIQHTGIFGIITLLQNNTLDSKNAQLPSEEELQKLSAAVDAASLLYPKQTLCLAWASAFTALALRKKLKINFVIGIQTNPFYAHAWAETISGKVINDDPLIAQALSVIFKTPY